MKKTTKSIIKITNEASRAILILGFTGLGVKALNDVANNAFKNLKATAAQEARKIKNELEQEEVE